VKSPASLALTVYRGAKSTDPSNRDTLTWGEFCDEIEASLALEYPDKQGMRAFGPYRLAPGKSRSAANVQEMSAVIGLDLDSVASIPNLLDELRGLHMAAIVHTSPSDPGLGSVPRKVRVYALVEPHDTSGNDELGRIVDWATPVQPVRYLCEGLGIGWVGKCAGLHGYAGTSKGLLLARIALSAAAGLPFLGHAVTRVPVVYCDGETGALAENRIKRLAGAMGLDLAALARDGWFVFRHVATTLDAMLESGVLERFIGEAGKGEGVLLCLDSYSSLVAGDENKSEYADALWALGQLGQRCNAIPLLTFHERKSNEAKGHTSALEGISGTNRLAAALASSIRLTPSPDNDRVITLGCTRAPERKFEPIELEWRDTVDGGIEAAGRVKAKKPTPISKKEDERARRRAKVRSGIMFYLATAGTPGKTQNALRGLVGAGAALIGEVLISMQKRGDVVITPGSSVTPNDKGMFMLTDQGKASAAEIHAPPELGVNGSAGLEGQQHRYRRFPADWFPCANVPKHRKQPWVA